MSEELALEPTPAAEPIAVTAPEQTEVPDEPESPPAKTFTQEELDEIVAKRIARERRKLEKLERERDIDAEVQRRLAEAQRPPEAGPPKREDFDSLEDYLEAKADWKVEQKLKERDQRESQREQSRSVETQQTETVKQWREKVEASNYADFDEVVTQKDGDELPISDVMGQAIMSSAQGVDVAYHLGKNPSEAFRIASLDPISQVFELGLLAAALKGKEKPVSKAAPPIDPVGQGSGKRVTDLYSDDLASNTEAWIKTRNAQIKKAG